MPIGRRLTTLLVVLALVALPAVALRAFCVGKSCDTGEATASAAVPFCPLPTDLRALISAGFQAGRAADAMAVTTDSGPGVATTLGPGTAVRWPSVGRTDTQVPIAFLGSAITDRDVDAGTGLDQIAPTLADALGYARPHPDVRAGEPVPGLARSGSATLVVQIAWKGVGTTDLEAEPGAWPFLRGVIHGDGVGTMRGTTGSLPIDPAATLTTIGTGGLPSQHGITGTVLRGDDGSVVDAWGREAPGSVIATLADDLDHDTNQAATVAGVLSSPSDRGIVGDGWYVDRHDRDHVVVTDRPVPAVAAIVDGIGPDGVIGIVLDDTLREMDRATRQITTMTRAQVPSATFAIAGTGSSRGSGAFDAARVADQVDAATGNPVVEATAGGGLFLDRGVATGANITAAQVSDAMDAVTTPAGDPLFADTFPSFAVAFARYC